MVDSANTYSSSITIVFMVIALIFNAIDVPVHASSASSSVKRENKSFDRFELLDQRINQVMSRFLSSRKNGGADYQDEFVSIPASSSKITAKNSMIRSSASSSRTLIEGDGSHATDSIMDSKRILHTLPEAGKYPWYTLLFKISKDNRYYFTGCAGSLVSSQFVLTSAHCLYSSIIGKDDVDTGNEEWALWVGALTSEPGNGGQYSEVIKMEESYFQEGFDMDSFDQDCALIKLKTNSTINPVNLTTSTASNLTTIGVGECDDADTKSTFSQTRLKEVQVNYIENELCTSPTFGYPSGSITDSMMCAIGDEYISTMCESDVGGSLYDTENQVLVGIVSWGVSVSNWGPQSMESSLPRFPTVYASIEAQSNWIKEKICDELSDSSEQSICGDISACDTSHQLDVIISITTDNYPSETSWAVQRLSDSVVVASRNSFDSSGTTYEDQLCLDATFCYQFFLYDSYGDGIISSGGYRVAVNNEVLLDSDVLGHPSFSTLDVTFGECGNETTNPSTLPTPAPTSITILTPQPSIVEAEACDPTTEDNVLISITTDYFPSETSWAVQRLSDSVVVASRNSFDSAVTTYKDQLCLDATFCYQFILYDSYGDGIYSYGGYRVAVNNEVLLDSDVLGHPSFSTLDVSFGECFNVLISITTDSYPSETSWAVQRLSDSVVVASRNSFDSSGTTYEDQLCLDATFCYHFFLYDSYGDGIFSSGGYRVTVNNEVLLDSAALGHPSFNTLDARFGECPITESPTQSPTSPPKIGFEYLNFSCLDWKRSDGGDGTYFLNLCLDSTLTMVSNPGNTTRIVNEEGLCAAVGDSVYNGISLLSQPCDNESLAQKWIINGTAIQGFLPAIQSVAHPAYCLDHNGMFNEIHLWKCDWDGVRDQIIVDGDTYYGDLNQGFSISNSTNITCSDDEMDVRFMTHGPDYYGSDSFSWSIQREYDGSVVANGTQTNSADNICLDSSQCYLFSIDNGNVGINPFTYLLTVNNDLLLYFDKIYDYNGPKTTFGSCGNIGSVHPRLRYSDYCLSVNTTSTVVLNNKCGRNDPVVKLLHAGSTDGSFRLMSNVNGTEKCIGIDGTDSYFKKDLIAQECSNSDTQKWILTPSGEIKSFANDSFCVDDNGPLGPVFFWECDWTGDQFFNVQPDDMSFSSSSGQRRTLSSWLSNSVLGYFRGGSDLDKDEMDDWFKRDFDGKIDVASAFESVLDFFVAGSEDDELEWQK